jgi:hypothetical protein
MAPCCPIFNKCLAEKCLWWIAKEYDDDDPSECAIVRLVRIAKRGAV